jgi:hypothetical protein
MPDSAGPGPKPDESPPPGLRWTLIDGAWAYEAIPPAPSTMTVTDPFVWNGGDYTAPVGGWEEKARNEMIARQTAKAERDQAYNDLIFDAINKTSGGAAAERAALAARDAAAKAGGTIWDSRTGNTSAWVNSGIASAPQGIPKNETVAPRVSAGIPPTIIPAAQPVVPAPAANPLLKQTKNPRRSKWSWSPGKF